MWYAQRAIFASSTGVCPTPMPAVMKLLSIAETVLENELATYAKLPSGVIAMPLGAPPTTTVRMTVFDPVSTTDTVLDCWLATKLFNFRQTRLRFSQAPSCDIC